MNEAHNVRAALLFILVISLVVPSLSQGETVSFEFTATVRNVHPALVTSAGLLGQTGVGRITYETSPSITPGGNDSTTYRYDVPPAEYTFKLAGLTFAANSGQRDPLAGEFRKPVEIQVGNDVAVGFPLLQPEDEIDYWGYWIEQKLDGHNLRMILDLTDSTATLFDSTALPNSVPDLSNFDSAIFGLMREVEIGIWSAGLTLSVDSIVPTVVPLPQALLLFSTGLLGLLGISRRKKAA